MPRFLRLLIVAALISLRPDAVPAQLPAGEEPAAAESPAPAESDVEELKEDERQALARAAALDSQATEKFDAGRFAEAIPLLEQAVEIRRQILGEGHADFATGMNNLATIHLELGNYARAEVLYEQAQEALKAAYGADHAEYAAVLYNRAALYESLGNYARAKPLFQEALAIRKRALGETAPDYAVSIEGLARLYQTMGNYAEAEPLYQKALAIYREAAGPNSSDYAAGLNNLARLYQAKGDYARAEPLNEESTQIVKDLLGDSHPYYAVCLNNRASLFRAMGDYSRAESFYQQALEIVTNVFGREHPHYAGILHNLAGLYQLMGEHVRAEPLLVEALEIQRRTVGEKHSDYATGLDLLAGFYETTGDYARAELLYQQAMSIRQEVFGEDHREYARSLNLLAVLYHATGDYVRAEPLCEQALAIRKASLGEQHPDYAASLSLLGSIYQSSGRYARAEPLYRRILAIQQSALGEGHPEYATTLNNLATLYDSTGRYAEAEPLYRQVLSILEETVGAQHADYASTLNNLAYLYRAMGETARAEPLYEKAREIRREILGEEHPDYAMSLNNLARVYVSKGEFARAEPLCLQAIAITTLHLDAMATGMNERQQLAYSRSLRYAVDNYLQCLLRLDGTEGAAFSAVLKFKGATAVRQRAVRRASQHPELADLISRLQSATRQWAALANLSSTPEQAEFVQKKQEELRSAKERLEQELARQSAPFREGTRDVTPAELAAALPDNAVLVDYFIVMQNGTAEALLAFVLNTAGDVRMFHLGPTEPIIADIRAWRASFGSRTEAHQAGQRLRERLWQPLAAVIGDAQTVLISPDAFLGTLPFAALPGKEPQSYLLEQHRLALIPVPRLLASAADQLELSEPGSDLLVMGGIDYDRVDDLAEPPLLLARNAPLGKQRRSTRSISTDEEWDALPGTAVEADAVKQQYVARFTPRSDSVVDLRGGKATEAAFRQYAPRCPNVHIATHGFFADTDPPTHGDAVTGAGGMWRFDDPRSASGYGPGLRSGLVFAGANSPPPLPTDPRQWDELPDDGILTADEIATMPLDRVDLVVLSACETGLGEVEGGEGLLGLQRAFQVAGAKATIASLWKVPDESTSELMAHFYTNLWQKQLPAMDALREAQLSILRGESVAAGGQDRGPSNQTRRRAEPGNAAGRRPPREWGAWILSGNAGF